MSRHDPTGPESGARNRGAGPLPLDDGGPALLSVQGLQTHFFSGRAALPAIEGVSFDVRAGETLAIVGESGSGKSVTALSILRLIPPEAGKVVAGSVRFAGRDLLRLDERGMRRLRGNEISMIFQEPMTALNPVHTIGRQLGESLRLHQGLSRREARRRAVDLLDMVRLSEAARRVDQYPHELSGGMRQRVMIAMALACKPKLLIADEPTTALDVTIQAQILDLMRELGEANGTTVLLITHDLGVVAEMAHRVLVMYAGRIVEESTVEAIFRRPGHPYTRALLASMPRLGSSLNAHPPGRLLELPGSIPALSSARPPGCAFAPRCAFAVARCRREEPALVEHAAGSRSACFEWEKVCRP